MFVKGSPKGVLVHCTYIRIKNEKLPITEKLRTKIIDRAIEYGTGRSTLRCLALATCNFPSGLKNQHLDNATKFAQYNLNLTFIGSSSMLDPLRMEVAPALFLCKQAGIHVVMITVDIDIFTESRRLSPAVSLTTCRPPSRSREPRMLACLEPFHNSKIVAYLQGMDKITAMTGDAVNNAPPLKKAEIGITMGSGTAAAKSASKMTRADNNFSSNIGEVVFIFRAGALSLPATKLSFNPPDLDIMDKPPRGANETLITPWLFFRYMAIGVYVGAATVGASSYWFLYDPTGPQMSYYQLTNHMSCYSNPEDFKGIACEIFQVKFDDLNEEIQFSSQHKSPGP